jgi:hypothetical protein
MWVLGTLACSAQCRARSAGERVSDSRLPLSLVLLLLEQWPWQEAMLEWRVAEDVFPIW